MGAITFIDKQAQIFATDTKTTRRSLQLVVANPSATIDDKIQTTVAQAQAFPSQSPQRQRILERLVRLVKASGKVCPHHQSTPDYEDALQQTWLNCFCNLDTYDATRSSFMTWFNRHLQWQLGTIRRQTAKRSIALTKNQTELVANNHDAYCDVAVLEQTLDWIKSSGNLSDISLAKHPTITAQALLLRRFTSKTPWKQIADEFGVPISTLSGFYQRQCLPRLRAFGQAQGYLEAA